MIKDAKDADVKSQHDDRRRLARIFLAGDVMIGRGIDQVLQHPCPPLLHESYVRSATEYVQLAEAAHGAITKPVDPSYVWGAALRELDRLHPDVRIINLETAITRSEDAEPKGINYRVSPENAGCLAEAHIDCCTLANNHVLDWGRPGLLDTIDTLRKLRIQAAGAGEDLARACAPAIIDIGGGTRVVVFSFATTTSGVPRQWAATDHRAGVNLLADLSEETIRRVSSDITRTTRSGDIVVVSVHWGPNWGYEVPDEQRRFARRLVDDAGVAIIHGHSSHHPKPIEVFSNRLILYGCGDFLNDYEGIAGYEAFRGDLVLMYVADVERTTGSLVTLQMIPLRIRQFRLQRAPASDASWLESRLNWETRPFGSLVKTGGDGSLVLSRQDRPGDTPVARLT